MDIIGVFQFKPLRWLSNLPDRFIRTLTTMHVIVYSLPTTRGTGSLRYSNNAELLRIKILRIDFFVELMLAAKFPYPLPTVSLGVY